MIKGIFFDIDGTLVSFKTHEVPTSTKETLIQLHEKGVKLFIATGRAKDGLDAIAGIPFDGFITLNGQFCYEVDGTVVYENYIPKEDIQTVIKEIKKRTFPCGFTMRDWKIYNYRDERVEELHALTHNDGQPAGDISHLDEENVYQLQAYLSDEEEKELMQKLPHCTSARWYPTFCDICPKDGTKVRGMEIFMETFGLQKEEVMAFGDGGNDLQMLQHAGIGVAMGNATDELKQHADYITDSVDDDGIKNAMLHFDVL